MNQYMNTYLNNTLYHSITSKACLNKEDNLQRR